MSEINENSLSYIAKYESRIIAEYFEEFSNLFGTPVSSLNSALSEIMLDFSSHAHLCKHPELAKINAPEAQTGRTPKNTTQLDRAVKCREYIANCVQKGKLDHAYFGCEGTASIIANLAYDLCRLRDPENIAGLVQQLESITI